MCKNYICTLLAAMFILSAVGCSKDTSEKDAVQTSSTTETESAAETEPERQPYIARTDYGGADFHILAAAHYKKITSQMN